MKLRITALLVLLAFSGCQTIETKSKAFGTSVKTWWEKPSTQEQVQTAVEIAAQFLVTAGLGYAQQSLTGVKINPTTLFVGAAATTLYSQASNIRKLQGTTQVLDPVATAQALQSAGTPAENANKVAQQIVTNIQNQVNGGVPVDVAAESQASKFDTAAAIITTGVNPVPASDKAVVTP